MPEPIADAAARRQALDSLGSYIVQAPAGSGKTELLIQRLLALLATVEHPESVVAITFTRKAAAEMRNRVLAALDKARGDEPEADHERQTWLLAKAVVARDRELDWRLQDVPSRLRIQTIDSLCASLAGQMPWLSRFGARPSVTEKAEPLYRQAARDTLALIDAGGENAKAVERLLFHLDNNAARIENLIVAMLAKRDQWLRHVFSGQSPEQLRQELEAALRNVVANHLDKLRKLIPPESVEELLATARFAAANLVKAGTESPVTCCDGIQTLPGTKPQDLERWRGLAALMLTADGGRRKEKGLNKNLGFPPDKESPESGEWKSRHADLAFSAPAEAALHAVRTLPSPQFDQSQWEVLEALLVVLRAAVANLRLVFQDEAAVDFIEIASSARKALGTPEQPSDLAFALDYRIQHLLVDEFQDTSTSQHQLLLALASDWQPGDGRTLFLVGDPMQSIYRFRDAEVGIFLQAWRSGVGNVPLAPLELTANFRSDAGIVAWVNRSLAGAFAEQADPATGAVPYARSGAARSAVEPEPVVVHALAHGDSEGESARVVEIIQRVLDPTGIKTTAVLVRSRNHLAQVVGKLREAGIRFQAIEIDALGEQPVVRDLLALTRALLHLGDRVSWLAILRAPWCGLTLADLYVLAAETPGEAIWDSLGKRIELLSGDGQVRAARFVEVIEQSLSQTGRASLRRWVEGTWLALGGPACLDDATALEHAAAYFDLLESEEAAGGLGELDEFSASVAGLYAAPDVKASPSLQVMTIHKAKGLQFDNVILPGLHKTTRGPDPPLLRWNESLQPNGSAELILAPIHERGAAGEPIYNYLKLVEAERAAHEDTRLLYVAATRAISRLFLFGQVKYDEESGELSAPDRRSLLSKIWSAAGPDFRAAYAAEYSGKPAADAPGAEAAPPVLGIRRLPAAWKLPAPPEAIEWKAADLEVETEQARPITFAWAGPTARHIGTVVHAMLRRIAAGDGSRASIGLVRAALAAEGVPPAELDDAAERALAAITGTQDDEFGRWLLAPREEGRSEYALSGELNGRIRHVIIDRTFVAGGERWIVDYKTSTHEGGNIDAFLDNEMRRYRDQLEGYAELMRRIDPRPIVLCLYFPLLREWRKWSPGEAGRAKGASSP